MGGSGTGSGRDAVGVKGKGIGRRYPRDPASSDYRVWGRRLIPSGARGRAPAEKKFLCILFCHRTHLVKGKFNLFLITILTQTTYNFEHRLKTQIKLHNNVIVCTNLFISIIIIMPTNISDHLVLVSVKTTEFMRQYCEYCVNVFF